MAGFLIVRGGPGTLDAVPEVAAARDVVMGFQVIRPTDGSEPFVHQEAKQFSTHFLFSHDPLKQGIWSTFGLDGALGEATTITRLMESPIPPCKCGR